jgi:hypothetical protein
VTEPSDAVNAGMAIQTEGRRLALRASLRLQLDLLLVGWLVGRISRVNCVVWDPIILG